jgi:hypothetical protein
MSKVMGKTGSFHNIGANAADCPNAFLLLLSRRNSANRLATWATFSEWVRRL